MPRAGLGQVSRQLGRSDGLRQHRLLPRLHARPRARWHALLATFGCCVGLPPALPRLRGGPVCSGARGALYHPARVHLRQRGGRSGGGAILVASRRPERRSCSPRLREHKLLGHRLGPQRRVRPVYAQHLIRMSLDCLLRHDCRHPRPDTRLAAHLPAISLQPGDRLPLLLLL